jgi:hypothetical protein
MQAWIFHKGAYMADSNKDQSKAKGGVARAKALSPEKKKEIAEKAAAARWAARPLKATHKGNFEVHFGIDAECYVLDDAKKTAVLTQRGIASAIGLSNPGGKDFERLVERKWLSKHIGAETLEKIHQPIEFKWIYPGAKNLALSINGYQADVLIDVCNAILAAKEAGDLRANQENLAKQAGIVVGASAKAGIQGLVYALAGYRPEIEEVISAFKHYVLEEAKKYEKEFPTELYAEWQRLYRITPPARGKNWKEMHLTLDHIYYPLAKSNGKLLDILRSAKSNSGDRNTKLFSFLNEVGTRALRIQLGRVLEMAESSASKQVYEAKIAERFGGQMTLQLPGSYPITS